MKIVIDAEWDGEGFYDVRSITVHTKEIVELRMSKAELLEWVEFTLENYIAGDDDYKLELLHVAPIPPTKHKLN